MSLPSSCTVLHIWMGNGESYAKSKNPLCHKSGRSPWSEVSSVGHSWSEVDIETSWAVVRGPGEDKPSQGEMFPLPLSLSTLELPQSEHHLLRRQEHLAPGCELLTREIAFCFLVSWATTAPGWLADITAGKTRCSHINVGSFLPYTR
jgi:hypothetical protein